MAAAGGTTPSSFSFVDYLPRFDGAESSIQKLAERLFLEQRLPGTQGSFAPTLQSRYTWVIQNGSSLLARASSFDPTNESLYEQAICFRLAIRIVQHVIHGISASIPKEALPGSPERIRLEALGLAPSYTEVREKVDQQLIVMQKMYRALDRVIDDKRDELYGEAKQLSSRDGTLTGTGMWIIDAVKERVLTKPAPTRYNSDKESICQLNLERKATAPIFTQAYRYEAKEDFNLAEYLDGANATELQSDLFVREEIHSVMNMITQFRDAMDEVEPLFEQKLSSIGSTLQQVKWWAHRPFPPLETVRSKLSTYSEALPHLFESSFFAPAEELGRSILTLLRINPDCEIPRRLEECKELAEALLYINPDFKKEFQKRDEELRGSWLSTPGTFIPLWLTLQAAKNRFEKLRSDMEKDLEKMRRELAEVASSLSEDSFHGAAAGGGEGGGGGAK